MTKRPTDRHYEPLRRPDGRRLFRAQGLPAQVREERKGDGEKEKHRKFEEKERKVEKGTKRPNAKASRFDKKVDEFFESEKAGNSNRPSWFAVDVFRTGLQRDDF